MNKTFESTMEKIFGKQNDDWISTPLSNALVNCPKCTQEAQFYGTAEEVNNAVREFLTTHQKFHNSTGA